MHIESRLNILLEEPRKKVLQYGKYVFYGGILVMCISFITFIVQFTKLYHISKYHKHNAQWVATKRQSRGPVVPLRRKKALKSQSLQKAQSPFCPATHPTHRLTQRSRSL